MSGSANTADYEQILRDPNVQGVVLCTPHSRHTDEIVAAAEGRAPYVVPQDQMIANVAAFEAVLESARTGNKVMVQ